MKYLNQFSENMMQRTKDVESQVEDLVTCANHLDIRLHNTFNQFLMLSDTQFVENVKHKRTIPYALADRCVARCVCCVASVR
jgi:hypothetical protein